MNSARNQILKLIREDKEYRDEFVAEHIFSRLPLKVRMLRQARKLSQQALASKAGVAKEWISQVENPNYGRFTLKTLLKIAAALDVALQVDFVPYSAVVNDVLRLSDESFQVPSAVADAGLLERVEAVNNLRSIELGPCFSQRPGQTQAKNLEHPPAPTRSDTQISPMALWGVNQPLPNAIQ